MAELKLATYYDSAPLHVLAEYMRDRVWLDVMTGEGLLKRVRIVQIIVGRRAEQVVFKQQWLEGGGNVIELCKQRIVVDGCSIWQVGVTQYTVDEIAPWGAAKLEVVDVGEQFDDVMRQLVVEAVLECTEEIFKVKRDKLLQTSGDWRECHHRHQAILVIYEMTDYRPADLCKNVFGYASQGPWLTARGKCQKPQNYHTAYGQEYYQRRLAQAEGMVKAVRQIGKAADRRLNARYRRPESCPFPQDYKPVLR
jgi:hypothetical protein